MTQTTINVLIGFGLVIMVIMVLVFIAIAAQGTVGQAAVFFCVMSLLAAMGGSSIMSAVTQQRKIDQRRAAQRTRRDMDQVE